MRSPLYGLIANMPAPADPAAASPLPKPAGKTAPAMPPASFRRVALVGRRQTEGLAATLREIIAYFRKRGIEVLIERATARAVSSQIDIKGLAQPTLKQLARLADLAVVVGGDGTMLGFARQMAEFDLPMVGINHGRLGFITDIALEDWRKGMDAVLAGRYSAENRSMLQAQAFRGARLVWQDIALNDVVVSRSSRSGMIELEVHVDDEFMYSQRADGLIISTPTGSTAYALSAHGPILHPGLSGIVLVPVAPQSLSNRPICLPDSVMVRIAITESRMPRVSCDMQIFSDLEAGDVIVVSKSPYSARFLHPQGYSYFNTLRTKLNWHEMPHLKLKTPASLQR